MTGQKKYESDKERKEAEKIAADKRAQAAAEETNLTESERTFSDTSVDTRAGRQGW
jgi:hypothetical protein